MFYSRPRFVDKAEHEYEEAVRSIEGFRVHSTCTRDSFPGLSMYGEGDAFLIQAASTLATAGGPPSNMTRPNLMYADRNSFS